MTNKGEMNVILSKPRAKWWGLMIVICKENDHRWAQKTYRPVSGLGGFTYCVWLCQIRTQVMVLRYLLRWHMFWGCLLGISYVVNISTRGFGIPCLINEIFKCTVVNGHIWLIIFSNFQLLKCWWILGHLLVHLGTIYDEFKFFANRISQISCKLTPT